MSLPSRERGLKFVPMEDSAGRLVAPFAGAWIEIAAGNDEQRKDRRSLRGSVD